jgi:hypothetical protein
MIPINSDCTRIYLKITVNRKTSYKSTGYFAGKKDWDEKHERVRPGYPNAILINAKLMASKNEWEKKIISNQLKGLNISAGQIKQTFNKDMANIFDYVDHLIAKQQNKKSPGTLENYRKHLLNENIGITQKNYAG